MEIEPPLLRRGRRQRKVAAAEVVAVEVAAAVAEVVAAEVVDGVAEEVVVRYQERRLSRTRGRRR